MLIVGIQELKAIDIRMMLLQHSPMEVPTLACKNYYIAFKILSTSQT